MAEQQLPNHQNTSDEIDLGQLFQMIGNGFNRLGRFLLRVFIYLKKNALIILGLAVLGGAIGYGLNQIVTKKLKIEVIVKPNLESKNYLYDVVDEIQANIKAKNFGFFEDRGIELQNLDDLKIEITAVENKSLSTQSEIKYLELLQSFENTDAISDIVRAELQNKSSFNHRITFFYKDLKKGQMFAKKIMDYINSNEYFDGLIETKLENALDRIKHHESLLEQINMLIDKFAETITKNVESSGIEGGRIYLDDDEKLDITGLLDLKVRLTREIEAKRLELREEKEPISIINFGKPQQIQKSFFGKNIILIPSILVGLFFLFSFLKFLNKKAIEIE